MSRMRCRSSGRRVLQGVAHPGELRIEHLLAQHVLDLLVRGACLGGAPLVVRQLADRPSRVAGSASSSVSAIRAASSGRGTAPRARPRPLRRAARAPRRACRPAALGCASRAPAARAFRRSASSPSRPLIPWRSRRLSAVRGDEPASTSSPISSSASRMSYGAASGSGRRASRRSGTPAGWSSRHLCRSTSVMTHFSAAVTAAERPMITARTGESRRRRPGRRGVLGQPLVQVQPLQRELDRRRRDAEAAGPSPMPSGSSLQQG